MALTDIPDYFAGTELPDALLRELHEQKISAFTEGIASYFRNIPNPYPNGGALWAEFNAGKETARDADRRVA